MNELRLQLATAQSRAVEPVSSLVAPAENRAKSLTGVVKSAIRSATSPSPMHIHEQGVVDHHTINTYQQTVAELEKSLMSVQKEKNVALHDAQVRSYAIDRD